MKCTYPPALTDEQINAALDDEVDKSTHQHLLRCPACQRRFQEARRVEMMLKRELHRWDCPPAQDLADYHFGFLSDDLVASIATHLKDCPHCRTELQELNAFIELSDPLPVPVSVAKAPPRQVKRKWSDVVTDFFGEVLAIPKAPIPASALRGARGTDRPLMFEAAGTTVFLEAQPVPKGIALMGQVLAFGQMPWTGALVELRQSNVVQATAFIDDDGMFRCELAAPGLLDVRITSEFGRCIVVKGVEFTV